jgi:hypothetical protein
MRAMKKMFLWAFAIVLMVSACKHKTEQVVSFKLNPPIPALDPAFSSFTIDAAKGDSLILPQGTILIVPPMAFADSTGKPIEGQVTLKYRAFYDGVDIFLAGIPMQINSNGKLMNLETAGMFEIRAQANGKQLKIADNKQIKIRFGSNDAATDINFFQLNEKSGLWEFIDYSNGEANPDKQKKMSLIEKLRPKFKVPFDDYIFVFNFNSLVDMYLYGPYSQNTREASEKMMAQKFQSYGLKWPDIEIYSVYAMYNGINYHPGELVWKLLDAKEFPSWTKGSDLNGWYYDEKKKDYTQRKNGDFKHVTGNKYTLTVRKDKKTFVATIEIVMPLKYLFRLSPEKWQAEYAAAAEKIKAEEEAIKMEADAYREFSASSFGVYNYDRLMKLDSYFPVHAKFDYTPKKSDFSTINEVFFFPADLKTVIKYSNSNNSPVMLPKVPDAGKFITIIPGPEIAVFEKADMEKLDYETLANQPKDSTLLIILQAKGQKINSADDLRKMLAE